MGIPVNAPLDVGEIPGFQGNEVKALIERLTGGIDTLTVPITPDQMRPTIGVPGSPEFAIVFRSALATILTDMAAATQYLQNTITSGLIPVDLTDYTQARFVVRTSVAGSAGSTLQCRYVTAVAGATAGGHLDLCTTNLSLDISVGSAALDTGWVNLVAGAKGPVFVSCIQSGGDGAADPTLGYVAVYFRKGSDATPRMVSAVNGMPGWQLDNGESMSMGVPPLPTEWKNIELEILWSTTSGTNGDIGWKAKVGRSAIGLVSVAGSETSTFNQGVSPANHAAGTVFSTIIRRLSTSLPISVKLKEALALEITAVWGIATGPVILHKVIVREGFPDVVQLRHNLMGTWWTRPRAVVNSNNCYIAGIKAYNGGIGVNSIATVDLSASPPTVVENSLGAYEEDDHNNGAIIVPATTRVPLTFWCTHGADDLLRYRKGTTVNNISTLHSQTLQTIDFNVPITYVEAHARPAVGSGEIHLLTRGGSPGGWSYVRSTDWGTTWGTIRKFIDQSNPGTVQMYVASSLMNDAQTLRCAAFAHPSVFPLINGSDHNIRCFDIDLTTGAITLTGTGGASIGNVQTGVSLPLTNSVASAYVCPAGRTTHVFDVGSGPTPMVIFAEKDDNDEATENSVYKLLVYTGGAWRVRTLCSTGQHFGHVFGYYVGGGAHRLYSDTTIYLSRENKGTWTIEKWVTADLGLTWTITVLSKMDRPQVRPFAIDGDADTSAIEVVWYDVLRYDVAADGNSGYDDNEFFGNMMGS